MRHEIDGQFSCIGGVNSGSHPSLLAPDQLAWATNVTLRGGFPRTRPIFVRRILTFSNIEQQFWFNTNRVQGWALFKNPNGNLIIVAVAGRLFAVDTNFAVTEITPQLAALTTAAFAVPIVGSTVAINVSTSAGMIAGYPLNISGTTYQITNVNNLVVTIRNLDGTPAVVVASGTGISYPDVNDPTPDLVWMKQALQWLVIQNDRDSALIFDGSAARRSNVLGDKPEVPSGAMMEYAEGRLWVVTNARKQIAAGDLFDPFNLNSAITFSEELVAGQTGRFVMPTGESEITGIKVIPNLDTSQGQGPLLVFTEDAIGSINVPYNRAIWKTQNYALTRLVQSMYGGMGQDSIVVVNGDIWNRAKDGLRTFIMAAAAFNEWGNVPQSREVSRLINSDTRSLLKFASGILFDNRLLMTYGPERTPNGVQHRGIVALDFDVISALLKRDMPIYDGGWTGVRPTKLLVGQFGGDERAFALCLNDNGENELWEIMREFGDDNYSTRIRAAIETRSFIWKNPFSLKQLDTAEFFVDEMLGTVDWALRWKPDFSPCWFQWGEATTCVRQNNCPPPTTGCLPMVRYDPGFRSRLGFGRPPNDCEPHDEKPAKICYRSQVRLEWRGNVGVKMVLLRADDQPDLEYKVTCAENACTSSTCCLPDETYESAASLPPTPDLPTQPPMSEVYKSINGGAFAFTTVPGESSLNPVLSLGTDSVLGSIKLNWDFSATDILDVMNPGDIWCYKVRGSIPTVENFSNIVCAVRDMVFLGAGAVAYPTWQIAFGDFGSDDPTLVTSLDLSGLRAVIGGTLFLDGATILVAFDLSNLEIVTGGGINLSISAMAQANFPVLRFIGGTFEMGLTPNVVTLNMPALVTLAGDMNCDSCLQLVNVILTHFVMENGRNYRFDNCALNAASVNHILARGVASGITSTLIDLSAGTNAAPTGQGVIDKAALITAGNSVSTN